MFSGLGRVDAQQPRHAESADARLTVRRDDQRESRGRRHNETDEQDQGDTLDRAVVSLESLRIFLKRFKDVESVSYVHRAPGYTAQIEFPFVNAYGGASQSGKPRGLHAQAVRAYQRMGQASAPPSPLLPVVEDDSAGSPDHTDDLARRIFADLDHLAARGVQTLEIRRGDNFMHSIDLAVQAAKSRLA